MRAHSRPVQNLRMGGCFLVIAFLTAPVQFAKDLIDHHDQPGCSHTALRRKRLPQLVCRLQRVATRWRGFHVGTDQKRVHHRCRILRTQVRHAPVPSIGHSLYVDGDSICPLRQCLARDQLVSASAPSPPFLPVLLFLVGTAPLPLARNTVAIPVHLDAWAMFEEEGGLFA